MTYAQTGELSDPHDIPYPRQRPSKEGLNNDTDIFSAYMYLHGTRKLLPCVNS